jgi:hypothetical protein
MYRKREFLYMLHPICIKISDIVIDHIHCGSDLETGELTLRMRSRFPL